MSESLDNSSHSIRRYWILVALAVIFAAGWTCYFHTLDSPFLFDGIQFIKENAFIKSLPRAVSKLKDFNRSLTYLSFAFNYRFSRLDPTSYHVVNITLHLICAFLVFSFARFTFQIAGMEGAKREAFTAAIVSGLIFACHPLHTQAVTYIYQRATVLAGVFYMVAMNLFILARLEKKTFLKRLYLGGMLIAAVMGFASKGNAFLFLIMVLVYEFYFFQDCSLRKMGRRFLYLIPAAALMVAFPFFVKGSNFFDILSRRYQDRPFDMVERLLTEFRILVHYISQIFLPEPSRLSLAYDLDISNSLANPPTTYFSLLFLIALFALALWSAAKLRILSFGILWFLINHSIESTVLPLELIFEHRNYIPSIGFIMIFAFYAVKGIERLIQRKSRTEEGFRPFYLLYVLPLAVIVLFGYWTYERNTVWQSEASIWADAAMKNPGSSRSFNGAGDAFLRNDELTKATKYLKRAIELEPDNFRAQNNMGIVYGKTAEYRRAIKHFKRAIQIKPNHSPPYGNIGSCYYMLREYDRAIQYYKRALELDHHNMEAAYNLGNCYMIKGQYRMAFDLADKLVRDHPENNLFRELRSRAEQGIESMR